MRDAQLFMLASLPDSEARLLRILCRHMRDEDANLSDAEFIRAILGRFEKERREPIIDVNE